MQTDPCGSRGTLRSEWLSFYVGTRGFRCRRGRLRILKPAGTSGRSRTTRTSNPFFSRRTRSVYCGVNPSAPGNLVHDFINTVTDFPLGGFLGVLCVLAVNADTQFQPPSRERRRQAEIWSKG